MAIKIAMIGAGSIGFTRRLMRDIVAVPELRDTEFAFTDLSERNLDMVTQLCQRDVQANNLGVKLTATTDRRAAIADCDYVISMIRQGGLEGFQTDIDIPVEIWGGPVRGRYDLRRRASCTPSALSRPCSISASDIREVAKPDALLLNYSNPMAMNTWACSQVRRRAAWSACATACRARTGKSSTPLTAGPKPRKAHGAWQITRWRSPPRSGRDGRRPQPPDLVHQGAVARDRHGAASCRKLFERASRSTAQHGKGPHRCAASASATTAPSPTAT
jgi:hypothetical protein